jgi:hypothetical protein
MKPLRLPVACDGEAAGEKEQDLAIGVAEVAIEAQERDLVAGGGTARGVRAGAIEQEVHADFERIGDAAQMRGVLPRARGLPLRDGAAGDADGLRELLLRPSARAADFGDAGAEGSGAEGLGAEGLGAWGMGAGG